MNMNSLAHSYEDPADQFEDDDDTDRAVERTRDGIQPVSAYEISPREIISLQTKLSTKATKAKEQLTKLEGKEKELSKTIAELTLQLTTDRRDFAIAKKLARVRKTDQAVLDAQEEAIANLEVEVETLQEESATIQAQLNQTKRLLNQASLTLCPLQQADFCLGTTKPLLTLQLVSGLRRNLVYRQHYLETQVDNLQARIAEQLELVNYQHGIVGFESQHDRDMDRMTGMEEELGEVYAILEVTGLLYDKVADLLDERQTQTAAYWPRDAVSIERIRREAMERQAEKEEVAAEIAARRGATTRTRR